MKVIVAKPPMYDLLCEKFPIANKAVWFTFGNIIYNPGNAPVPPQIMAHEQVHCERQGNTVTDWWMLYMHDKKFRLVEELHAHRAEFKYLCEHNKDIDKPIKGYRSLRELFLIKTAQRLAHPVYNNMITVSEAKRQLCAAS